MDERQGRRGLLAAAIIWVCLFGAALAKSDEAVAVVDLIPPDSEVVVDNAQTIIEPPVLRPIRSVEKTVPGESSLETVEKTDEDVVTQHVSFHRQLAKPPVHGGYSDCPVFYRQRPVGPKRVKRRIMLNNRLSEPHWYKYYRCQHYGYHPTQWNPWPCGWMTCRNPHPGDHPYDIRPEKKSLPKDFDPDNTGTDEDF